MLQFKPFQRDDLARAASLDSAILGWEQGLGKSLAAIALPLIKRARRVAARYKQQEFPVMVAGLKAMGKGHSFECARHLILPSMSFALDETSNSFTASGV